MSKTTHHKMGGMNMLQHLVVFDHTRNSSNAVGLVY